MQCSAFAPPAVTTVAIGASSYSVNSGILDVPSVNFNEEQLSLRLEFIEGSNPMQFETLSIGAVQSGPSEAAISALGGGLITESSQDFDPLTNALTFVPFTDVAVGNSCTNFTTSPDGTRLAYTCPTFNRAGTILIATNNDKLYFFDVVAHLILEDFELGLLDGESIKKIRISTDGNFLLIFLENEVHDDNSKFYWMPMPAITGTPL